MLEVADAAIGERKIGSTTLAPLGTTDADHPPATATALEMVNAIRARQDPGGRSNEALTTSRFIETLLQSAS